MKCNKKCEETVQQEVNLVKADYEETIKTMKVKVFVAENQNIEYSKAIKVPLNCTGLIRKYLCKMGEIRSKISFPYQRIYLPYIILNQDFLKKVYNHQSDQEIQRSRKEDEASEKEAQETACNILNMTPEELTGFINEKASNTVIYY